MPSPNSFYGCILTQHTTHLGTLEPQIFESTQAETALVAFEVMLLPPSVAAVVSVFYRLTWAGWSTLASRVPPDGRRQHLLGAFGALSMVLLFTIWIAGLILGFGLMLWAAETRAATSPVSGARQ